MLRNYLASMYLSRQVLTGVYLASRYYLARMYVARMYLARMNPSKNYLAKMYLSRQVFVGMYLATHYLPNRNRNPNPNPLGNGWQRHCEVSGACGAFPQTVDRQDSPVATVYGDVPPALAVEGEPPPRSLPMPPPMWRHT